MELLKSTEQKASAIFLAACFGMAGGLLLSPRLRSCEPPSTMVVPQESIVEVTVPDYTAEQRLVACQATLGETANELRMCGQKKDAYFEEFWDCEKRIDKADTDLLLCKSRNRLKAHQERLDACKALGATTQQCWYLQGGPKPKPKSKEDK